MVAAKKEATRSMCRKGFVEISGGDHMIYDYIVDGERISRTKVSHGGCKDLNDYLLGEMADDCHLSKTQFFAFVKCWMSEDEYRQILVDKGVIKG
jgi:hypothetical protein